MKSLWLDRSLLTGPYVALCVTQAQFDRAMRKDLGLADPGAMFKTEHSHATTHFAENPKGDMCAVVTIRDWGKYAPIEVAGLLVHEAVHIWQWHRERIGENEPGMETEAYAIQTISIRLMDAFTRLTS